MEFILPNASVYNEGVYIWTHSLLYSLEKNKHFLCIHNLKSKTDEVSSKYIWFFFSPLSFPEKISMV